jgi:hypothetical protein
MNEVQVLTLITLLSLLVRKVLKCLQKRHSDCMIECPCFKMNMDLEAEMEVRSEHAEHVEEHEMSDIESAAAVSSVSTDTDEEMDRMDLLDFENLTKKLHEMVDS